MTHTCKTCSEVKDDSEFRYSKAKNGKNYRCKNCKDCERLRYRQWHASNKSAMNDRSRKYKQEVSHGLGEGGYEAALQAQDGLCAICGTDNPGSGNKSFAIDHDHTCCPGRYACSKCFRGLLCGNCNNGIGRFHDNPETLRKAAEYLVNFRVV